MSYAQYMTVFDGRDIYEFPNGHRIAITFDMSSLASVHIPNLPPETAVQLGLDVHDVAVVRVDDLDRILADVACLPVRADR